MRPGKSSRKSALDTSTSSTDMDHVGPHWTTSSAPRPGPSRVAQRGDTARLGGRGPAAHVKCGFGPHKAHVEKGYAGTYFSAILPFFTPVPTVPHQFLFSKYI